MLPLSHCGDEEDGCIGLSSWLHFICITLLALCFLSSLCFMKQCLFELMYLCSFPSACWALCLSTQSHCGAEEDGHIGLSSWLHFICITLLSLLCWLSTLCVMNFCFNIYIYIYIYIYIITNIYIYIYIYNFPNVTICYCAFVWMCQSRCRNKITECLEKPLLRIIY